MATVTFEALMFFVQCHTCIVKVGEFYFLICFFFSMPVKMYPAPL